MRQRCLDLGAERVFDKSGDIEDLSASKVAIAGLYCDHYGEAAPGARFAARQVRRCLNVSRAVSARW